MFSSKYYNRYLDDYFDRQYYGARLKLKKFDTEEFQSLSYIYNVVSNEDNEENLVTCVNVDNVSYHYNPFTPILNKVSLQVPQGKDGDDYDLELFRNYLDSLIIFIINQLINR